MRITDDRYSRDTARMDLAIRLIRLEARTRTIRSWTGLSDDRIRKLYRSYLREGQGAVRRHRGKSPQRPAVFLGTGRTARHANALASLLWTVGAVPTHANKERGARPALACELVCDAYEAYCSLLPSREIGFEHAVLLATALAGGRELRLAGCRHCNLPMLADSIALRLPVCENCGDDAAKLPQQHPNSAWHSNDNARIRLPAPTSSDAPRSARPKTGWSARSRTAPPSS